MRIAFDSWVLASRLRRHGTYVYAWNLISQFKRLASLNRDIEFCLFSSQRASNDANLTESAAGFELTRSDLLAWDRWWRVGGITLAAAKVGADVIFSPTSNILPLGPIPVVSTIHDAIPLKMRVHSWRMTTMLRSFMWSAARLSTAVITDSKCSKNDLLEMYGLPESRISVVHLGFDSALFNDKPSDCDRRRSLLDQFGIGPAYIFHHGVIQPRKNLVRLIQAYRLIRSRNRNLDVDLVLAGRIGWEHEEIVATAREKSSAPGKVILTGALEDMDLALLLKRATLVVIPSLYEGFCLPMVEAMASGAPTVAANSSCLVEISGGVLQYFNPLSVEEMADCIERHLESVTARVDLARRGKARATCFSWERCATETLDVLRKTCEA